MSQGSLPVLSDSQVWDAAEADGWSLGTQASRVMSWDAEKREREERWRQRQRTSRGMDAKRFQIALSYFHIGATRQQKTPVTENPELYRHLICHFHCPLRHQLQL